MDFELKCQEMTDLGDLGSRPSIKMRVGCDLRGVLKVDIWVKLPCPGVGITSRKSEKVLK